MRVRFAQISRFGESQALSSTAISAYNEVMDKVSSPVREAIGDLRDSVSGYSWAKLIALGPIYGGLMQAPENVRAAIGSALNTLTNRLNQLEARRADVMSGALPLNKWIGAVSAVFDGVKVQARDLGESTILAEFTAHFNESVNDAKQLMARLEQLLGELGDKAKVGLPILGIAAILAAIFIVPRLLGGHTTVVVRDRYRGLLRA